VDLAFDGVIRVRRYLCRICKRTVSLLPEFALPWLRFGISVIALFLVARLIKVLTLATAAPAAGQSAMPYQRGQFWIRRFQKQAPALSLALTPLAAPVPPVDPAADFVSRALRMLESIGWIAAHRFLFSQSGRRRRACTLASVRRSNCTGRFAACSFREDSASPRGQRRN
jgi:hypothetical protein